MVFGDFPHLQHPVGNVNYLSAHVKDIGIEHTQVLRFNSHLTSMAVVVGEGYNSLCERCLDSKWQTW